MVASPWVYPWYARNVRLGANPARWVEEALGAVHPDGTPVGARAHLAVFAFYANKQMTTAQGGIVTTPDPEVKRHRLGATRDARPT